VHYTAATCDPDEFMRQKYTLRPYLYGRKTELFIVLTMYNEDEVLFVRTMNAVIKNVAFLCGRTRSKMWGLRCLRWSLQGQPAYPQGPQLDGLLPRGYCQGQRRW